MFKLIHREREKRTTEKRMNKQKTRNKMANLTTKISIITLSINGLDKSTKRGYQNTLKNITYYVLSLRNSLQMK